jgi:hypothetical protein
VVECQFIKKREHSRKLDQYLILNSLTINQESEELELEEVTINSEPLDSEKVTSIGLLNHVLEKQEFWTLSIMPLTIN